MFSREKTYDMRSEVSFWDFTKQGKNGILCITVRPGTEFGDNVSVSDIYMRRSL